MVSKENTAGQPNFGERGAPHFFFLDYPTSSFLIRILSNDVEHSPSWTPMNF
jgi:hypothetical protein